MKEVHRLVGLLTSLSRFIPMLAERIKPILKIMKKDAKGHWDEHCERAFKEVREILTETPVMRRPYQGCELQLFLAVDEETISATLVQETPEFRPIYFVSRILKDVETRYQRLEKVVLALLNIARRLRPYFQGNQVVVRTDYPIAKILRKPNLAGRMIGWSVELSEFGLRYEPQGSVRGQHLADFVAELPMEDRGDHSWRLFDDESSGRQGGMAGIVLEGPDGMVIE